MRQDNVAAGVKLTRRRATLISRTGRLHTHLHNVLLLKKAHCSKPKAFEFKAELLGERDGCAVWTDNSN